MRLIVSIVSFCIAVVLLGAGIAQRTIFLQPGSITQRLSVPTETLYTVIDSDVLALNPGAPTVTVNGTGPMVVAYGRTSDVLAWIGAAAYTELRLQDGIVQHEVVRPVVDTTDMTAPIPVTGSPAGSDLWLNEGQGTDIASVTSALPPGYSAIIASDGTQPAPSDLLVAWPTDNSTPWVGPLLVLGAIAFTVGSVLLWFHWRDTHRLGPRRRGQQRPTVERAPTRRLTRAPKRRELGPARGRRSRFSTVALVLLPLTLTGCSAEYWPGVQSDVVAAPSETPKPAAGDTALEPAVTIPQMERILQNIASFTTSADKALATDKLAERFAGPALAARAANYAIRSKKADYAAPTEIPAKPLTIALPQQVDNSWPRLVMTVSQDPNDSAQPPVALLLLQNDPRDNYHVYYAITLVPNAQSPQLAPATIGAPRIPADSKLLKVEPNQVATSYADVLNLDAKSQWAALFQAEGDTLREQLGINGQAAIRSKLPANATIAFSAQVGNGPALALATNDAGAIVAVQVDQLRRIQPTGGGVVGFGDGSGSALLSGFTGKSQRGVQSTSGLQLLVYIPAVDSAQPVRVLGWTESLIAASEIPG